ncbi:hypothetical protein BGZ94_006188, partial [Podila epigama]
SRTFDAEDIIANALGTTIGLISALGVDLAREKLYPTSRPDANNYEAVELDMV